jgi:hypothetical protein
MFPLKTATGKYKSPYFKKFLVLSAAILYIVTQDNIANKIIIDSLHKRLQVTIDSEYVPSSIEQYILDNSERLGYNESGDPLVCGLWTDPEVTADQPDIHPNLHAYVAGLENYSQAIHSFSPISDLMPSIIEHGTNEVCDTTRIHPDGHEGLFPANLLSFIDGEYMEPLLPPMRSPKFCWAPGTLMSLDYLVHDFESFCHKLRPHSNKVLIDMGASLDFHNNSTTKPPMLEILELYEKFGFNFDHVYAFEVTPVDPKEVFEELLPEKYMPSYHWINTGVNATESSKMNPLRSILKRFSEDDFIVVKLDIDTPFIEIPLVQQILEGGEDNIYHRLIDVFYFEHHVHLGELAREWDLTMEGTVKDSLDLFYALRKKGISAHFWP